MCKVFYCTLNLLLSYVYCLNIFAPLIGWERVIKLSDWLVFDTSYTLTLLSWNWRCQWVLLQRPKVKTVASVAAWHEMRNCVQISTPDSSLVTRTRQGPLIGCDQCRDLSDVGWAEAEHTCAVLATGQGLQDTGHLRGGSCQHQLLVPRYCLHTLQPIVWGFYWQISFPCRALWIQRNVPWWKNVKHCTVHCTAEWVGHCLQ